MSEQIREAVRQRYAELALTASQGATCCGPQEQEAFGAELYDSGDRDVLPDAAALASLGCGDPTAVAELREGEVVWTSARAAASTCCCRLVGSGRQGRPTAST